MNVMTLLPTSADELHALQNGKNTHTRKRQPGKERQTERIRAGYDIRFFVEGDIEEREGICVRRIRDITKTETAFTFKLEPLT